MSRYRKISTRIWNDAKFSAMSDDGKLAFFFVLTHPHMTSLGAMRATVEGLAAELGWASERLSKAFREATDKGVLRIDERARCMLLLNFIKHNPPESPNVVIAWEKALDDVPECALKSLAIQSAISHASSMSEGFAKACQRLSEAFAKGMPYQEQEQEQELEQEQEQDQKQKHAPSNQDCSPPHPEAACLPLVDGTEIQPTEDDVNTWVDAFPAVAVLAELRKARSWLVANPKNRKTRAGWRKFVNGWLSRAQDRAPTAGAAPVAMIGNGPQSRAQGNVL